MNAQNYWQGKNRNTRSPENMGDLHNYSKIPAKLHEIQSIHVGVIMFTKQVYLPKHLGMK